jgi:hypothetical protein
MKLVSRIGTVVILRVDYISKVISSTRTKKYFIRSEKGAGFRGRCQDVNEVVR